MIWRGWYVPIQNVGNHVQGKISSVEYIIDNMERVKNALSVAEVMWC
jgi:hypothetical protein